MWSWLDRWTGTAPILAIGATVFVLMALAALAGYGLHRRSQAAGVAEESQHEIAAEGFMVTSVLTLLGLLLGFTFNLATERFETRRQLVVDEANAIGTAYLRAQLLPEPHRRRIGDLLIAYTDNRIALASAPKGQAPALMAKNDALTNNLWAATSAAMGSIRSPDFSNALLTSTNNLIDLGASRKIARFTHVPGQVFVTLFVYMIASAGVLGYVLTGARGRLTAALVLALMALFLLLVVDIDRPTSGGVRESQEPMLELRASLKAEPPQIFDRYKTGPAATAGR